MSHTAHIPSHRKPRRSASKLAVRAGVAGGVLSTLAMAGTASASPSEPVAETTLEMPVLDVDLAAEVSSAVTTAAENTRSAAVEGELTAQEESARTGAAAEAKKAKEDAQQKADAEKKAKDEEARKAEAERANRSTARASLSTKSTGSGNTASTPAKESGNYVSAPATGSAAAIVNFARAQVGKAYVMGGTGPSSYDCSGLVQAAYRQAGISLPRVSGAQSSMGTSVSLSNLQPGDILYWGSRSNSYHVAIYAGGGKFIGAQNPSTGIVERTMDYDKPSGAVRIL